MHDKRLRGEERKKKEQDNTSANVFGARAAGFYLPRVTCKRDVRLKWGNNERGTDIKQRCRSSSSLNLPLLSPNEENKLSVAHRASKQLSTLNQREPTYQVFLKIFKTLEDSANLHIKS